MKYIAAVTALGCEYPEYINFSQMPSGEIRISGREAPDKEGKEGRHFQLDLPAPLVELMFEDGLENFAST